MPTQSEVDTALDELGAQVTNITTVVPSAIALLNGIQARLDAAIAETLANNPGIRAEQLSAITAESAGLGTAADDLAAAVAANTPAA